MKDMLIIIGASGHGKVVADIAIKLNKWQSIAYFDDDDSIKTCMGLQVIGKTVDVIKYKDKAEFFIAIGNNLIRERIYRELENIGIETITLIHPSAIIGNDVEIGLGTVVMAGTVINSSSRIGKACIINTSSSVDHDNLIGDFVHIAPGVRLAGTVKVGNGSWLGIGSVVSNNLSICSNCKIGAGSVVTKDIPPYQAWAGNPARFIKERAH